MTDGPLLMQPCPWFSVDSGCCYQQEQKMAFGTCHFVCLVYGYNAAAGACLLSRVCRAPPTWPYPAPWWSCMLFLYVRRFWNASSWCVMCSFSRSRSPPEGAHSGAVCTKDVGVLFLLDRAVPWWLNQKALSGTTCQAPRPRQPKQGPEALQPLVLVHPCSLVASYKQWNKCRVRPCFFFYTQTNILPPFLNIWRLEEAN